MRSPSIPDFQATGPGLSEWLLRVFYFLCLSASLIGAAWLARKNGITPESVILTVAWMMISAAICVAAIRSDGRSAVVLALSTSVMLRLWMWHAVGGSIPIGYDPRIYHDLALGILHGEGMAWTTPRYVWQAVYPPLYPLLLAGAYAIGGEAEWTPAVLNFVIDAIGSWVILRFAVSLGAERRIALAAASLYLLWPNLIVASVFPNKEGLANLLVLICCWTLARTWLRRGGLRDPVILGASMGMIGLTQPGFITFPALLATSLLFRLPWQLLLKYASISGATLAVVLLPWWIRNWLVLGHFVPFTTSVGLNFYTRALRQDVPAAWLSLPEAVLSAKLFGAAVDWIIANPITFAVAKAKAILIAFGLEHARIEELQLISGRMNVSPISFGPVMQTGLLLSWSGGLLAAWRSKGPNSRIFAAVLILCLVHFLAFGIWFEFAQRHRSFLTPLTLIFVAVVFSAHHKREAERSPLVGKKHPLINKSSGGRWMPREDSNLN